MFYFFKIISILLLLAHAYCNPLYEDKEDDGDFENKNLAYQMVVPNSWTEYDSMSIGSSSSLSESHEHHKHHYHHHSSSESHEHHYKQPKTESAVKQHIHTHNHIVHQTQEAPQPIIIKQDAKDEQDFKIKPSKNELNSNSGKRKREVSLNGSDPGCCPGILDKPKRKQEQIIGIYRSEGQLILSEEDMNSQETDTKENSEENVKAFTAQEIIKSKLNTLQNQAAESEKTSTSNRSAKKLAESNQADQNLEEIINRILKRYQSQKTALQITPKKVDTKRGRPKLPENKKLLPEDTSYTEQDIIDGILQRFKSRKVQVQVDPNIRTKPNRKTSSNKKRKQQNQSLSSEEEEKKEFLELPGTETFVSTRIEVSSNEQEGSESLTKEIKSLLASKNRLRHKRNLPNHLETNKNGHNLGDRLPRQFLVPKVSSKEPEGSVGLTKEDDSFLEFKNRVRVKGDSPILLETKESGNILSDRLPRQVLVPMISSKEQEGSVSVTKEDESLLDFKDRHRIKRDSPILLEVKKSGNNLNDRSPRQVLVPNFFENVVYLQSEPNSVPPPPFLIPQYHYVSQENHPEVFYILAAKNLPQRGLPQKIVPKPTSSKPELIYIGYGNPNNSTNFLVGSQKNYPMFKSEVGALKKSRYYRIFQNNTRPQVQSEEKEEDSTGFGDEDLENDETISEASEARSYPPLNLLKNFEFFRSLDKDISEQRSSEEE